jgi:hypothetical protein
MVNCEGRSSTWSSRKLSKGASGSHPMTCVWSRSTVTVEGSLCDLSNPPCVDSLWEETGAPGENPRLSAERWPTLFTWVRGENQTHELRGERCLFWRLRQWSDAIHSAMCVFFSLKVVQRNKIRTYPRHAWLSSTVHNPPHNRKESHPWRCHGHISGRRNIKKK